jgi:hypothetical protein
MIIIMKKGISNIKQNNSQHNYVYTVYSSMLLSKCWSQSQTKDIRTIHAPAYILLS